jgi:cytochrome P450
VSDALGKSDCEDPEYEDFQEMVKSAAASTYSASVDPTVSTLGTFILAMLTNPEAQRKAQCEIDAVVGSDRLPQFEDMEALPYVSALLKEVLRWRNVTPIGSSSGCTYCMRRTSVFLLR